MNKGSCLGQAGVVIRYSNASESVRPGSIRYSCLVRCTLSRKLKARFYHDTRMNAQVAFSFDTRIASSITLEFRLTECAWYGRSEPLCVVSEFENQLEYDRRMFLCGDLVFQMRLMMPPVPLDLAALTCDGGAGVVDSIR